MNGGLEYWRNGSKSVLGGKRARDASECRRWQSMGFPRVSEQLRWHPRFGITAAAIDSWTCVTGLCEPGWMKASTCWKHESSMMIHHRIFGNLKPFFSMFRDPRLPEIGSSWIFLKRLGMRKSRNWKKYHTSSQRCWNLKWDLLGDVWHSLYPHAWYINRKTYPHLHISYTSATHWPCFSYISSISQLHTNYIAAISAILMFPETSWMPSRVLKTHGDIKISHFSKPSWWH